MHCYCTLFDRNYLSRGLTLFLSLKRHVPNVKVVLLCLDKATYDALGALSLDAAELVLIEELERYDPTLVRARIGRSPAEYYFTCKAALMRYVALSNKQISRITYLDSDLLCFADPTTLAADFSSATVILTPHRFPPHLAEWEQYGRYNAGWVSTSTDEEGMQFIEWWRERCLEWCELKVVGEKFADQKYLDQVADAFPHSVVLPHSGVNAGPWRLADISIEYSDSKVLVEGYPLIFFHFHGLKQIFGKLYDSGLHEYRVPLSSAIRKFIYQPYLTELCAAEEKLRQIPAEIRQRLISTRGPRSFIDRLRYAKKLGGVFASRTLLVNQRCSSKIFFQHG